MPLKRRRQKMKIPGRGRVAYEQAVSIRPRANVFSGQEIDFFMYSLLQPLKQTAEFKNIRQGLSVGMRQQLVFGVAGSQRAMLAASIIDELQESLLLITPSEIEANLLAEDLGSLLPGKSIHLFPVWQLLPYQVLATGREIAGRRLKVLEQVCFGKRAVVVASIEALMRRLTPPEIFRAAGFKLEVGRRLELGKVAASLTGLGYQRADLVEGPGQFGLRGGILDVFPPTAERPYRVEFFDDEVDSIRIFNLATQRSEEKLKEFRIPPTSELVIPVERYGEAIRKVNEEYQGQLKKLARSGLPGANRHLAETFSEVLDRLQAGVFFSGIEQFLPYLYPEQVTLIDYLPGDAIMIMDEPQRIRDVVESISRERSEIYSDLLARGRVLPGQYQGYLDWRGLQEALKGRQMVLLSFLPRQPQFLRPQNIINLPAKTMHGFMGHWSTLAEEIRQWKRNGYAVVLLVTGQDRARRLLDTLREYKLDAFYVSTADREIRPGNIVITHGGLSAGFELTGARLVVITETEIFGQRKKRRRERPRTAADRLEPFAELKVGDPVVHVNHGVGRYMGIVQLEIAGVRKEYLLVKYAGEDKLYVPADQVGLLQKYLGAGADAPRLSRLGGAEWSRVKNRVREAVRDMAQDLLTLYAFRQTITGYSFSPDTVWQKEFEERFPYEETPDQLSGIEEVKADMERSRPMDRLLCGDVGYGKTEVALRAAFKSVMDGKQVAVLVPTTILAQQHFNSFRERFAGYPVRVEMLSRFRTAREQRLILADLRQGLVDIVIGTHRLVQEDVVFHNLGLVVVDEEQRFGVAHKEKLKQLRQNVDVLTLTATPIPRTLHMSLVGVRDTSLLETPPENRFPVQTYVLEEDPVLLREAIRRELGRGGQVYFVHNRVMELNTVAGWIQSLVPEARLGVAHGQMREEDLEQVMIDFMEGVYDILVCTTIIESGLDITNVNTLIVKDAQNMGLAQLYQLRGRVGRSNRLAYAYFTFRRDRVLKELAEKRLAAIKEFTEFGSGYKIAMRDLEIRGAGNLLGPEQHGHIAAVGFDLYCRLLEEAVQEARGQQKDRTVETLIELPVEAYIPDEYVPDANQKVDLYRRLAAINDPRAIDDLEEELVDRFGDIPGSVRNLLGVARLRVVAGKLKVKTISRQQGYFRFQFAPFHPVTGEKLVQMGEKYCNKVKFITSDDEFEIRWMVRDAGRDPLTVLAGLEEFLVLLL
jgi:transcription-repair coupling factor (superfamily II helicase)